jgi:hypothetical protein
VRGDFFAGSGLAFLHAGLVAGEVVLFSLLVEVVYTAFLDAFRASIGLVGVRLHAGDGAKYVTFGVDLAVQVTAADILVLVGSGTVVLSGGLGAVLLEVLGLGLLLVLEAGEDLLDLAVDLVDILNARVKLSRVIALGLSCTVFVGSDAAAAIEGALHILVDQRFLHFTHLAEEGLFILAGVGFHIVHVHGPFLERKTRFLVASAEVVELATVEVIPQSALLETVDCEGLLEGVLSEGGSRWIAVFVRP